MPFDTWIGTGRVGGIICCIIAWDLNHLHIWVVMDGLVGFGVLKLPFIGLTYPSGHAPPASFWLPQLMSPSLSFTFRHISDHMLYTAVG